MSYRVERIASGPFVTTWVDTDASSRWLRKTAGVIGWSAVAIPTDLAETIDMQVDPKPYREFGIYIVNSWRKTVGSGTWATAGYTTRAVVFNASVLNPNPAWSGASNYGAGHGGIFASVLATPGTGSANFGDFSFPANIAMPSSGGELIRFHSTLYGKEFRPYQNLNWFLIIDPITAPTATSGQTVELSTEVYEVYSED